MTTTFWLEAKGTRTDHTGVFHAYHDVDGRRIGPYCGLRHRIGVHEVTDAERLAQGTQCARCLKAVDQTRRERLRRFGAPILA